MIQIQHFFGKDVGVITVEGQQDEAGKGYFRAFTNIVSDGSDQLEEIHSISRKGFFIAVVNLCKRLDKLSLPFSALPSKWQIYIVTHAMEQMPFFTYAYLSIQEVRKYGTFAAHLKAPPHFMTEDNPTVMEDCVRQDIMNSYEDASGQTCFGALANLCQKFHYYDYAHTIDSLVLDSLTASFFLPTAFNQDS